VPEITSPASILFDLDPSKGADIRHCIQVAFLVKDVIEQLGLKLFPKVSGSKGIQVVDAALYEPLSDTATTRLLETLRVEYLLTTR
jgi:bifunctional non-homologous end joining protein LigD